MKTTFNELKPLLQNKRGILSLEHSFVYAFMDVPLDRIYDVWEIPPFGRLGDSPYDGLQPNRVDCVLVSKSLATAVGAATNTQLRYQNYIAPYVDTLVSMGATSYNITGFGRVVALGTHP
ncbi:MAG: hypothetical protein HYZ52_02935 [Candidatus Omnitrophica bacterium]|nr:hypothetical protein [Candidatus Omnitrophota bacterium]